MLAVLPKCAVRVPSTPPAGIWTAHTEFGGRASIAFDAIGGSPIGGDCNGVSAATYCMESFASIACSTSMCSLR